MKPVYHLMWCTETECWVLIGDPNRPPVRAYPGVVKKYAIEKAAEFCRLNYPCILKIHRQNGTVLKSRVYW